MSRRWQFSAGVIAPVLITLVTTVVVVTVFIYMATSGADRQSLERQTRIVSALIAEQFEKIPHDQESIAIWDDAVRHTRLGFDFEWVDVNLGTWMHDYFGHDQIFILDERGEPIYAHERGGSVPPVFASDGLATIAPMIQRLRNDIAGGALAAYESGESPTYPRVTDAMVIEGLPALVSVVPLTSDSGDIVQEPGTEFLHVSVVFLDSEYAEAMASKFFLEQADFAPGDRHKGFDAHADYPILNSAGSTVAHFEWTPYRPGTELLNQMAPAVAIAFLLGVLVIVALLDRLWRSSSALEAGRKKAEHIAKHDALTGLINRAHFEGSLASALVDGRSGGKQVALMMLDLDRFKQVNDTLGHQAGDELIRGVGQRLNELLEEDDVLARLGGDEFAIVHFHRSGTRGVMMLAQRIIDAIGKPFDVNGREAFVGASVGVVLAEEGDTDRQELARKADIALYEAKASGRNRAVVYHDEMNELVQNRHTIESELREALRRDDQLSVAYQPLFSRDSGTVKGAEALVRWHHPRLGQISPAHFIPVAEATGLIEPLGEFVLRRACEVGSRWPGMTIAVNISPRQLRNPNFARTVFDTLADTGMRATDLELEITEGVLIEDDTETTGVLNNFRAGGIRIALDDFGTGYSSLHYLKRYPVDTIKIDRSFVSQLSTGSVSVAIVQAMVTLAHALNVNVTAEGVETQEQMSMLAAMGCNTFQGFLLSAPVTQVVAEGLFRGASEPARIAAVA